MMKVQKLIIFRRNGWINNESWNFIFSIIKKEIDSSAQNLKLNLLKDYKKIDGNLEVSFELIISPFFYTNYKKIREVLYKSFENVFEMFNKKFEV